MALGRGFGRDELARSANRSGSWRRGWLGVLALSGLALALAACAAPQKAEAPEEPIEFVWPMPPDKPRIKFIRSLSTERDVGIVKETSFADILLGKEDEDERIRHLEKPYGVHADREGRVFVGDTGIGKLVVFDIANKKYSVWGEAGNGALAKPGGITSDSQGRIYVTDAAQKRIVIFDRDGRFLSAIGQKGELDRPVGIAVNEALGRVYVVDTAKHQVAMYDIDGPLISTFGERGNEPGQFNYPTNLAMDRDGKLYVVDSMNFRVQVLDPDGNYVKSFGQIGDNPGQLARPKGIAVDSQGHVYVVDAAFNNFQIFNQEGKLMLFVGRLGFRPGEFWLPAGAYIDGQDRLYVADQYNLRVQVFQFLGGDDEQEDAGTESEPGTAETAEEDQGG
ncbi:MAG: 6-bladed beta-propeller [Rhodospirillales bacterium]|nr:6-bladed beta-propeller [Rhodospirillales bacterium]